MVDLKVRVTGDAREARAMFSEMTSSVTLFGSETEKTMTAVQKRIAAMVNAPKISLVDTKSAADSARVFEELSAGAARLRAELDPVGTALSHIDDLFRRGAITAAEFDAASSRAIARHQATPAFVGPRVNPFADDIAAAQAEVQARLSQGRYDRLLGVASAAPKSAADSASVFAEAARASEELERSAASLRSAIDPLGASQAAVNVRLAEYRALAAAAMISAEDLARAEALAAAEMDAAYAKHQTSTAFVGPRVNPFADDIAAAQAEVQARLSQGRYDHLLGVASTAPKSAADSASVFAEAARASEELERRVAALRAAIDPLGVAQAKVNGELAEYRALAAAGKITAQELAQAEVLAANQMADAERTIAMRHRGGEAGRLAGWEKQQLAYQVNDILTMGMMGASPFQILASQGGQVYQVLAGAQGGVTGAVKGLATEIWGLLGPTGAAAAGILALSAAGYAYLAETRDLSKVLEEHKSIVDDVAEARARATRGAGNTPLVVSSSVAAAAMKAHEQDLGKLSEDLSRKLRDETRTVSVGGVLGQVAGLDTDWTRVKGKFEPFEAEINRLVASIRTGKPAILEFQEAISRKINLAPFGSDLVETGGDLLKFSKDAASTARFLEDLQKRFSETALAAKSYVEAFRGLSAAVPDYLSPDRLASSEKYRVAVAKIQGQYNEALGNQQGNPQAAAELERRRTLALAGASDEYAAATWKDKLLANRKAGVPEHAVKMLDPSLGQAHAQVIEEMRAAGMRVPRFSEGYRTADEHVAIHAKDPIHAAKPGTSLHEKGKAMDVERGDMTDAEWNYYVERMRIRGMVQSARDKNGKSEPWHFTETGTAFDDANRKTIDTFGKDESWRKAIVDFRKGNDELRTQSNLLGRSPELLARQRAEIELTAQAERIYGADVGKVRAQILTEAEARGVVARVATQQKLAYQSMHDAAQLVGEGIADGVTGLIGRVETFEQATQRLVQSLLQASVQAMLLGQGPLAGLFGTQNAVPGQMGGIFGSLFSGMFGSPGGGAAGAAGAAGASTGGGLFASLGKFFGFYADGGTIPAGGFGIAGEAGAELIMGPSTVVPMRNLDSYAKPSTAFGGEGGAISNILNMAPSVTVNMSGSSGNPAQDRAHADAAGRAVKRALDEHAAGFARDQMRAGGIFKKKDFEV